MFRPLLIFFFLLGNCGYAQPDLQWAHGFASSQQSNFGEHLAIDKSGNVYTTGRFHDSTDFDPGPGTFFLVGSSNSDYFISKLDAAGNLLWAVKYENFLYDIAVDDNSNVFVTGAIKGVTTDLNPGTGTYNVTVASSAMFVTKFNSAGNFLTAKVIESPGYIASRSLVIDADQNVLITGYFQDTTDFDPGPATFIVNAAQYRSDIFILKLNNNADFIWVKSFGAGWDDHGIEVATDANCNIYFTGKFMKYVDFDPGPENTTLYSTLWDEIYVCKLTKSGDYVWAKQFGADGIGLSIRADANENVVFSGYFKSTVDFDPGPGTHMITAAGTYDAFLARLNSNGDLNWVHTYGGTSHYCVIQSIDLDLQGNIYAIGGFDRTIDADGGSLVKNLTTGIYTNIFMLNLNPAGHLIWGESIGGNHSDIGYDLAVNCGSLYITGFYRYKVDFDTGLDTAYLYSRDTTVANLLIARYDLIPSSPDLVQASKDSICSGEAVSLTANGAPLANGTNWQWYQGSCGGNYVGAGASINILPTVSTTFYVRSEGNCRVSDCKPISVNLKESPDASASLTCKADCSGVLMNCKNESVNADGYIWEFNDGSFSTDENPEHYFTFDSGFGISLTAINNSSGCKDTLKLDISSVPLDWFNLVIPNVFTPNNDGINDLLKVSSEAAINNCFSLKVFNRWGMEVYSSGNLDAGWNGRNNTGGSSEPGIYYYVLKVDEFEYQGTVTLLE